MTRCLPGFALRGGWLAGLRAKWLAGLLAGLLGAQLGPLQAQEYSFDAAAFARKPVEIGGQLDFKQEGFRLSRDSTFYKLNFYNKARPDSADRSTLIFKPEAKLRFGDEVSASFRGYLETQYGSLGDARRECRARGCLRPAMEQPRAREAEHADPETGHHPASRRMATRSRKQIDARQRSQCHGSGNPQQPPGQPDEHAAEHVGPTQARQPALQFEHRHGMVDAHDERAHVCRGGGSRHARDVQQHAHQQQVRRARMRTPGNHPQQDQRDAEQHRQALTEQQRPQPRARTADVLGLQQCELQCVLALQAQVEGAPGTAKFIEFHAGFHVLVLLRAHRAGRSGCSS